MGTLIERAMSMESREPVNTPADPPVPRPQWSIELEEAWKACREQIEARVKAAEEVA